MSQKFSITPQIDLKELNLMKKAKKIWNLYREGELQGLFHVRGNFRSNRDAQK